MEIDCCEDVGEVRGSHIEFCKQFNFSPGNSCVDPKLARDGDEVFLENLEGKNSGPSQAVLGDEIQRSALLGWSCLIISVDKNIRVEKATCAHGVLRD